MINDILPRHQEIADGKTQSFAFPFEVIDNKYINVYLNSEKQESGFTVENGAVFFEEPPVEQTLVTITRVIPIDWQVNPFGVINEESLNNICSFIIAKIQTLQEEVSRSIKSQVYDRETGQDLSEQFIKELTNAVDSLEKAKVLYEEVRASGTQALSDIMNEKNLGLEEINNAFSDRLGEFNQNADEKLNQYNTNAAEKKEAIDEIAEIVAEHASNAAESEANAAESAGHAAQSEKEAAESVENVLAVETRINETLNQFIIYEEIDNS